MNNSQLAHNWFYSVKEEQQGSNIFYEKNIIYSYGYHFPIAIKLDKYVLFNSNSYSNTTSKHQNHVLNSIDDSTHKRIHLPLKSLRHIYVVENITQYVNFDSIEKEFNSLTKKLAKAKKPQLYINEIESIKYQLSLLKQAGGKDKRINKLLKLKIDDSYIEKAKLSIKKEKKQEEKRKLEQIESAKISLYKFLNNEANSVHYLHLLNLDTVIRLSKDKSIIETSKGMKIPLNIARLILHNWESNKALGMKVNIDNYEYICTLANESKIKFGCHIIDKKQALEVLKPILNA